MFILFECQFMRPWMPWIGATTENKIWDCGIKSWDEFREEPHRAGLPESKQRSILEGISTSKEKLNARDHTYFASNLPKKEHWRAYREFRENTIFLDIETTGLFPYYNEITYPLQKAWYFDRIYRIIMLPRILSIL